MIGNVNINKTKSGWNIACENCTLSYCVMGIGDDKQLLIVHQPAFLLVPTNISGEWVDESGIDIWRKITNALTRKRRFVGMMVAGILALIAMIASATTAGVALAREVQIAHTVNMMGRNVSKALNIQEDINRKMEERLNALWDAVQVIGEEVLALRVKTSLRCHKQ